MKRSGKTYRVMLAACLAASEGKNVAVVSQNSSERRNAIDIARQISKGFAKFEGVDTLRFSNDSWVKFFIHIDFESGRTQGLEYSVEIFDDDLYRGGGLHWKIFQSLNEKEN